MTAQWFVVQTAPQTEERVAANLARLGYRTHFPLVVRRFARSWYRDERTVVMPLFPRFLFVFLDPETDPWGNILRVYYVQDILRRPGSPFRLCPLPTWFVEAWQAVGRPADGAVDEHARLDPIAQGSPLRLLSGAFAEHQGICTWSSAKRVGLLLRVLGKDVSVNVLRESVEAV